LALLLEQSRRSYASFLPFSQGGGFRAGCRRFAPRIADMVNCVRGHFGNRFKGEVKPADVQALR